MSDLMINGKDAFATWGVRMGTGFLDSSCGPLPMKDFIENKSRLEHGKRVLVGKSPKIDERNITLSFTLEGNSKEDFQAKKNSFFNELYKGKIAVQVPANGDEIYHLIYTGKNISYAQNKGITFCKFSCKFNEPNPANRV